VKILYFAWVKTKVGVGEETIDLPDAIADVGGLIDWLKNRSPGHSAAFADLKTVRAAVNQDYALLDHPVAKDDEVAFFPPVTGG